MDDIGNLVYLAFIIISVLVGAWKNFQKKKEARPATVEAPVRNEQRRPSVDELDELNSNRRRKDAMAEERLAEMERKAKEALEASKRSKIERRPKKTERPKRHKRPNQTIQTDLREFDARKAIIYSEILNPPYL